jgi:hypothetical protein
MTGRVEAQFSIPGAGGGPGAGIAGLGGAVPAATTAVPTATPQTLWSFLGLSKQNLAACQAKLCASPLGTMANNMVMPYSSMTGGLVPSLCPAVPSASQLADLAATKGPNSAEAVAAKIKQDEADAKARRAAVRYLSTVDCHYWPEAEGALIVALRDDRNECVRYEAALALLNGCCCTEKTIEALNIVVSGSEKDGKPSETSERVRGTAFAALQGCLAKYHPRKPKPLEPPEPIPLERPDEASPAGTGAAAHAVVLDPQFRRVAYYYQTLPLRPASLVVAEAHETVARLGGRPPAARILRTGERSVYHALARAANPPVAAEVTATSQGTATEAPFAAPAPPLVPREPSPSNSPARTAEAPRDAVAPASFSPSPPPANPAKGQRSLLDVLRRSLGQDGLR